jgi:protein-tyrosine kinase
MKVVTEMPRLPALRTALSEEQQIGALLIDSGKLLPEDAERVLNLQKTAGLRFGEAAVKLGLVTEADVQKVLSAQFSYPYLHGTDSGIAHEVVAAYSPFSRQVETLRALRSQLMLRWFDPERKMLAVVSPSRREGRSYLVANLAVVFSQLGERTLLIDADMRRPHQHKLFNLPNQSGLSSLLAGRGDQGEIKRVPALLDLSILTAGAIPPNPQELLGRSGLLGLLKELAQQFDIILLDSPSADSSADVQMIATRAGGALMLARRDRTRLKEVVAMAHMIRATGGQIVGSVLNNY